MEALKVKKGPILLPLAVLILVLGGYTFLQFRGVSAADRLTLGQQYLNDLDYGGAIAAPVFQKVASRTLAYNGYLPDVTFAMAEQAKERALTPAQREQRRKDAIYLANLAKYRAEKARKERERAQKMAGKALADNTLMPNLRGLTLRKTIETCVARGIIPTMEGSGTFVLRQSPAPGSRINEDSTCTVWLTDTPPDSETSPSAAKE